MLKKHMELNTREQGYLYEYVLVSQEHLQELWILNIKMLDYFKQYSNIYGKLFLLFSLLI